ncbi:30S ribosome-binding factor RbfA [Lunatibacter salilacus]|uniref:30S ribosome-binding factor RbfA n=1 Tax=Lunatibacter salilacus TaxID=2483804 RepID=UPI00131D0D91|nr:30S ribosome-binding factor RbfA [Lunatibacter salilacus]
MESKRQQKYSKLIQKELGDIFQRESRSLIGNTMVTVTRVLMSPDLGVAKVYLSFLGGNTQELFDKVNDAKKTIRRNLGQRIGKSVRIIPELALFLDESAAYAQHMDGVISKLDIPEASDEEDEDN